MELEQFETLKQLHEHYSVNNRCGLKSTATQPVYEVHPPTSGIIFIGEAPGKDEDLQGQPFVGASGKFLDEMLKTISLTRKDVYVTNVVKYRPPNNREPQDIEKTSCRVWLNAELLFLKPTVIVPLGKHALERFVDGAKISAAHGLAFSHPSNIPIFAMYHPAVALYNPSLKSTIQEDFLKLKKFIKNGCKLEDLNEVSTKNKSNSVDSEQKQAMQDILDL